MRQSLRHQKIVELVKQKGYLSTDELVALFDVSPQTIRRDLNELAEANVIRRHHGGAASPSTAENSDYHDRKHFFSQEKNRIAHQVVQLIPNGASLFIDIGTTSEAVAFALLAHQKLPITSTRHIFLCKMTLLISPLPVGLCVKTAALSVSQRWSFYHSSVWISGS